MLYEKKMLILSGDGKGVVLIEKGGHGVTFSLRTFDMLGEGPFKAGIITRSSVHVRDLPQGNNPAAAFTVDVGDISELHFAVFDKRLRLYGTNTKRMWESNIMQLLDKHDKRDPVLLVPSAPPRAELPPLSEKPRSLPMPDGTGIPQSRLSLYGDEAVSESNFYTALDFSSRMSQVDNFLDEPRVLDELAPRLVTTGSEEVKKNGEEATRSVVTSEAEESNYNEEIEEIKEEEENVNEQVTAKTISETTAAEEISEREHVESTEAIAQTAPTERPAPQAEAASASALYESDREMPWEITANWLKNRTDRQLFVKRDTVKPPKANDRVRYLRESRFFERAHADIDKLFSNGKKDDKLSALLPDISWVRVEFDGHCISVGRGEDAFLCYAVAGRYEKSSPIGDEAQWLPSDSAQPTGNGYWLIFQNLENGEIIKN